MTDVHELLARTHQALGDAGATLDHARHDALLSGIRRRRRRRHAAEVLGVSALVLALGAGGWLGLSRDGAPQPAQSTSPTPEPTSAPTPDTDAAPQPAPDAPGLLPALVMPPGTLEASTPGWVLTVQQPRTLPVSGDGDSTVTAHAVDAVTPDGTRYRVVDLPLETSVDLVRWDAGTTQALVTTYAEYERSAARLDLLTGELTPLAGLAGVSELVGRTAAGQDVWVGGSGLLVHDGDAVVRELPYVAGAVLDPSGTRVAGTADGVVVTVDVATGGVTEVAPATDVDCQVLAWHGDELVVSCLGWQDSAPVTTEVFRIAADGSATEGESLGLPADRLPARRALPLPDGRLVVQHTFDVECTRGWGLLDPEAGTLQDVPLEGVEDIPPGEASVVVSGVAGDVVLLAVGDACSGIGGPLRVFRHDLSTGTATQLAGPVADESLPDTERWLDATTSTILAS